MRFVTQLLDLLGPHRRSLARIVIGIALYEGTKIVNPFLFKEIIDTLIVSHGSAIGFVLVLIAAMFVIDLVNMGIDLVLDRVILKFLYGVEADMSCSASAKLFDLPLGYHERERAGNTITRVDRGVAKFIQLLHDSCWQGVPTSFQILITIVAMAVVDWQIAVVFAVFIPPFCYVAIREQMSVYPHRVERYSAYEDAFGFLGESIWNMLTIQSFARETERQAHYSSTFRRIVHHGREQYLIGTRHNAVKSFIVHTGRASVLLFAAWRAWTGHASIGSVVLFLTLSEKAYISLFNFAHLFSRIADAYEGVSRLHELFQETSSIRDDDAALRPELAGGVTFDSVQFAYPTPEGKDDATPILRGVTFSVQRGETIALAGPSGSGKSTVVKLLFRHYDVLEGSVRLDEYDVRRLARGSFRKSLGYVPQEGQLFNGTIAENIRFGLPEATEEDVEEAARLAGASEFITTFPEGYATTVGEQGVHLSGGQRQRICIARALVRKPKILVFDEATSSLDAESERVIQESLERLHGTVTIIVIAHRLSTIQHADRILVIEEGQIIEEGTHEQLLRENGLYQRLVALQESREHAA
jgi:ABC-type multidrug transport system fused ATPase/permease subunit